MSQLDQIQLSFVAAEDRLLLRVSTQTRQEFRFWLTRRFVRALRPALKQALAAHPHVQTQPNPVARQALVHFQHEAAVQASDFNTPFRGVERELPLGDAPVLLTGCQLRARPDGGLVLALGPAPGPALELALDPQLLHSFVALLDQALQSAAWDLDLAAPSPSVTTPAPATIN